MATLTISMPDTLREFVDQRVSGGGYGNTSEYVRELVRRDREALDKAKFEAELLKGVESPTVRRLRVDQLAAYAKERTAAVFAQHKASKVQSASGRKEASKGGVR